MVGSIIGGIFGLTLSLVIIDELHLSPIKAFLIGVCVTYLYSTVSAIWFEKG